MQPADEKKASDFRNKFEKFGGATKSFKRVSVPAALDVLSSSNSANNNNNNNNKVVKDLQKQIEDLEKKTQKERESMSKKNEKLKQEYEKEAEEFKERNKMVNVTIHLNKMHYDTINCIDK